MNASYLSLATIYKDYQFKLLDIVENPLWLNDNPILLTKEEVKEVNIDLVCQILAETNLSPLHLCELNQDGLADPVINKIETAYNSAIEEYRKLASGHNLKDHQTAGKLNVDFQEKIKSQPNHTARSVATGLALGIVGAIPGYFLGASKDRLQDEQNQREKIEIQRTCSKERRDLLKKIDELEKERYRHLKKDLQDAGRRTHKQLQSRSYDFIHDEIQLNKYRVYERIFRKFFPHDTFVIEQVDETGSIDSSSLNSFFSEQLKIWVEEKFLKSPLTQAKDCLKLLVELYPNNPKNWDTVFLEIIKIDSYITINEFLSKLHTIFKAGRAEAFFHCLRTEQSEFYTNSVLFEIIDDFLKLPLSATLPYPFPAYDSGGRDYFKKLSNLELMRPSIKKISSHDKKPIVKKTAYTREEKTTSTRQSFFPGIDDEKNISNVLEKFSNDNRVTFSLSKERLELIKNQYSQVIDLCQKWQVYSAEQLVQKAEEILLNKPEPKLTIELVALGRLAIFKEFQKYLYPEQVLTVLAKLSFPRGCVAQVLPGEGKTLISILLIFVLALKNKTIHVISSSANLVKRDKNIAHRLFKNYGISTSHICEQHPQVNNFRAKIIYGRVHDFEFAIMREILYNVTLFPQAKLLEIRKRFDCVFIDELDNLMMDTALNSARLSYLIDDVYQWVYLPILLFIKQQVSPNQSKKLTSQNIVGELKLFLKNELEDWQFKEIQSLSDQKIIDWIVSAFKAFYVLKEKEQYVVQGLDSEYIKKVFIVDADNTGRILQGSRWSNGLHEFVEVKHELNPDQESLTPLSLSNAVFYQFFEIIYGLTGTMGSENNHEEIKEIYGLPSFDVPPHLPCRRDDQPLQIIETDALYWQAIIHRVFSYQNMQRPILILCETIQESEYLSSILQGLQISFDVLNELQKDSEDNILARAAAPGSVTIATNTAGRGTDIILEKKSRENGGLHVLITFYPDSFRIEYQARSRAGRQGEEGSSEIIVSKERIQKKYSLGNLSSNEFELFLNKMRETTEQSSKESHLLQASFERFQFNFVLSFFNDLTKFRQLISSDHFLSSLAATYLCNFRSYRYRMVPPHLDLQEKQFVTKLYDLFYKKSSSTGYTSLLRILGQKIEERCLNYWSRNFSQKTDELFTEADSKRQLIQEEYLKLLNLQVNEKSDIFESLTLELKKKLETETKNLYTDCQTYLGKYLDPSGKGLIVYLEEISGLTLIVI